MKKWFPSLPDSFKPKPGQIAGPCHHFGVVLSSKNPAAKKSCKLCNGTGNYVALNIGEYEETPVNVQCPCVKNKKRIKK